MRTFLSQNTFDFKNSNHVNWIISRAQIQRLQQVRCVEFEAHWMKQTFTTGNGIPERNHFQGLQRLGQLTALKRLRLRFGALDESDEYGYRRWMAKTKATRDMYYRQVLSHVMRWLPILAQAVVVEVIIDTHARWTGPERWREARTIVTLRYVQSAPGQWRMIGDADEQEEQVAWQPNVHHEHARERKCGGCTAELITS